MKSEQEINQPQHLFFSALGEFSVERKEKGIKEKPFDSTIQVPLLEAGVVGLREIVTQSHDGVEKAI